MAHSDSIIEMRKEAVCTAVDFDRSLYLYRRYHSRCTVSHDVSKIWIFLVRQVQEGQLRPLTLILGDRHLTFLVFPAQDEVQRNGG